MRKHGTNRPSIAAILAISALLVTSLVGSAFAASSGTQSKNGSAAWLVNYYERDCNNGSVNTSDNVISDGEGYFGVWVKSSNGSINVYDLDYVLLDKGNNVIQAGNLYSWDGITCGAFVLLYGDQGWANDPTGSLTLKVFTNDGKSFGNDSARFV